MEILLSKPGGEREGPFTLEQINAGLLQKQFKDSDYWAWYEGLDSWVPLHQVPGVADGSKAGSKAETQRNEPTAEAADDLRAPDEDTQLIVNPDAARTASGSGAKSELASGLPLEKLEQIFVFTDGEGPAA